MSSSVFFEQHERASGTELAYSDGQSSFETEGKTEEEEFMQGVYNLARRGYDLSLTGVIFYQFLRDDINDSERLERIKWCFTRGASVGERNVIDGKTFLHIACEKDYLPTVEYLFDAMVRDLMDKTDPSQMPTLKGQRETVNATKSFIINKKGEVTGQTPLHVAAAHGAKIVCRWLLKQNADVRITDVKGRTPLHHAVRNKTEKNVKVVKEICTMLLSKGAPINAITFGEKTALDFAVETSVELAKILIIRGAHTAITSRKQERNASLRSSEGKQVDGVRIRRSRASTNAQGSGSKLHRLRAITS